MPTVEARFRGIMRFYTEGNEHHAVIDVRAADGGNVRLQRSMPLRPIEEQIVRQGNALPAEAKAHLEQDQMAGLPGADAVRKLARKVATSRLRKQLEDVLNDPRTKLVGSLAEKVVPGFGATAGAVRVATSLVSRARKGDPEARRRVAKMVADAAKDPRAASALALVKKVGDATRRAAVQPPPVADAARARCCTDDDQGDDNVSGWWWNTPYRGNAQAMLESVTKPSPSQYMRGMFRGGLDAMKARAERALVHGR